MAQAHGAGRERLSARTFVTGSQAGVEAVEVDRPDAVEAQVPERRHPSGPGDDDRLRAALDVLLAFLGNEPLTARIARLEERLTGTAIDAIPGVLEQAAVDQRLLSAAFLSRQHLGRLNDLIHATAIALALPHVLEPRERLVRPSLAAGNDPSRPFDIETDRRVAEFKLARWQGTDATRKRQVFKDLVHLAAEGSGRRAELYVLGPRPLRFLRTSRATAKWALDRSPRERQLFAEQFGPLVRSVADFTATDGAHVRLIDLEEELPAIFRDFPDVEHQDDDRRED